MKKYFEILELDESASIEEAERAYKELIDAWRPENYQNLPRFKRKAETKIKEINAAYERVKSYLATRPPIADRYDQPAADQEAWVSETDRADAGSLADTPLQSGAQREPDRPSQAASFAPEGQPTAPEKSSRLPIRKPAQRSLLFGFLAILTVLGVLMLARVSDRQTAVKPVPPTPAIEKVQPAADADPQPATMQNPNSEPDADATAKLNDQKQPPAVTAAAPAAPAKKRIVYEAVLKQTALRRSSQNSARVKRIQESLIANGYDTGPIDGIIGPQTTGALQRFAGDHNIGAAPLFAPGLAAAVLVYAEVAAAHPDWHHIIGSDDFARWLDSQSYYTAERIQKLKKYASARQVNDILDRYKSDKNMSRD